MRALLRVRWRNTQGRRRVLDIERRLGDRIVYALQLALDQGDLEVSELLERALESVMTRFGGPDKVETRDVPDEMIEVFDRIDELRRRVNATE